MTLDTAWIKAELAAIDALVDKQQEKGKRLETLMTAIFSSIDGLRFEGSNTLNFYKTEEIDLMFWNDRERLGVHFLDCPLIVECKSSKTPLSGRDLRYFATTLRDKGRCSGVVVALAGVAGKPEESTAGFFHMTAALMDGVTLLVVTEEDLLAIGSGADLVALLQKRLIEVVKSQVLKVGAAAL